MTNSSSGAGQINVTPLIDVLLVLLIIFMVITPLTSHGLEAAIPQPATGARPAVDDTSVVITVAANGDLTINLRPIVREQLPEQLRKHRTVFVKGAPDAEYQRVVEVIDLARGAGVPRVGIMPNVH